MSAWRAALYDLHNMGGIAGGSLFGDKSARSQLRAMGLIAAYTPPRRLEEIARRPPARESDALWRITALGAEVVEGRVTQIETRPGGRRWVATWLRSLPQLRITA